MSGDRWSIGELKLYIENTGELYGMTKAITANLDKKVKAGKYDSALAPKAWLHLVDAGAERYVREIYGEPKASSAKAARVAFPTVQRAVVAKEMSEAYEEGLAERGLHIHKDRHLCGSCAAHEDASIDAMAKKLRKKHR